MGIAQYVPPITMNITLNPKFKKLIAKVTQIKNDLVDYGKGLGKSAANTVIDFVNMGKAGGTMVVPYFIIITGMSQAMKCKQWQ